MSSEPLISSRSGFSDMYLSFSNYFLTWHSWIELDSGQSSGLSSEHSQYRATYITLRKRTTYYRIQNLSDLIVLEMLLACFSTQTWIKPSNSEQRGTQLNDLLFLLMPK